MIYYNIFVRFLFLIKLLESNFIFFLSFNANSFLRKLAVYTFYCSTNGQFIKKMNKIKTQKYC